MTPDAFLTLIKKHGATVGAPADDSAIQLANARLMQIRAAMLPAFMRDLYAMAGGMELGCAAIFGPTDTPVGLGFPIPSIMQINEEIADMDTMRGKTVFARNNLFWFAFDAFGVCYMLDNLTLKVLRQYDDPYRAMTDCMAVGQI
ncbi:hypothetical protein HDR63_00655 [bacterium]|nr:hypothetical protein [bacterium]